MCEKCLEKSVIALNMANTALTLSQVVNNLANTGYHKEANMVVAAISDLFEPEQPVVKEPLSNATAPASEGKSELPEELQQFIKSLGPDVEVEIIRFPKE